MCVCVPYETEYVEFLRETFETVESRYRRCDQKIIDPHDVNDSYIKYIRYRYSECVARMVQVLKNCVARGFLFCFVCVNVHMISLFNESENAVLREQRVWCAFEYLLFVYLLSVIATQQLRDASRRGRDLSRRLESKNIKAANR